jgi:type II secretory pathway component PulC
MISPLLKWQFIACAVLSGGLLVEWGIGKNSLSDLQEQLKKSQQSEYHAEPLQALAKSNLTPDSYSVIQERPLFIEGRKPLPEVVPEAAVEVDNGKLDDWELIGIYNKDENDDKSKMALFRKLKEAKTFLKLNETQMISGWQLKQIQADRVVLQQGGQEKSVMLRKPRQQTAPTPAARRSAAPGRPMPPRVPPVNNSPENRPNES